MPGTAWRPPHTRAIHDGHVVVTSYGCAAGGLAACVTAVGLAEWSHLTKLLLDGPPAPVRELTSAMTGAELAPGGTVRAGGFWWCAESAGRTLVLGEPTCATRLRAVLGRHLPRQPRITAAAVATARGGRDDRIGFEGLLTRRELDVLRPLADGGSNRRIAEALVISEGTVKFHVNSILRKLRVSNRAEAVSRYLRLLGMRAP